MSQNGFCTKHMEIRLQFVRELIINNCIKLNNIQTCNNYVDFLTKPTGQATIQQALKAIGVGMPASNTSSLEAQGTSSFQIMTSVQAGAKQQGRIQMD
jgi:hypothetical protein